MNRYHLCMCWTLIAAAAVALQRAAAQVPEPVVPSTSSELAELLREVDLRIPVGNRGGGGGREEAQVLTRIRVAETLRAMGEQLPVLLEQVFVAGDERLRRNALWALDCVPENARLPILRRAVADPVWQIRASGVSGLHVYDFDEAFAMASVALADPDVNVRTAAIRAFSPHHHGDTSELPPLFKRSNATDVLIPLLDEPTLSLSAAYILGQLQVDAAGDAILRAYANETSRDRAKYVDALGALGSRRFTVAIVEILQNPQTGWQSRQSAAEALGKLSDMRATPALIDALSDDSLTYGAARSLGQIGDRRAVPALIDCLNGGVRRSRPAAEALAKLGDPRAVEPLIQALKSSDESTARAAAAALGELGDPRAVEPLSRLLNQERQATVPEGDLIDALSMIRHPRAIEALVEAGTTRNLYRVRDALQRLSGDRFQHGNSPAETIAAWWEENRAHYMATGLGDTGVEQARDDDDAAPR